VKIQKKEPSLSSIKDWPAKKKIDTHIKPKVSAGLFCLNKSSKKIRYGRITLVSASKRCIRSFLLVYSTKDEQRAYIK
jgi:hypothetical protein